ncbi:MAG: hypothetical protein AAGA67_14370 [Cyanobacteria bacterium P01_F01_bin.153]
MSWLRGTQGIAVVLALGLLGCGEAPQSSENTASAAQESPQLKESSEPMESSELMESSEPGAKGASAHGSHGHGAHDHGAMEPFVVPEGEATPTVELTVKPDPVAGWNVQVAAENFEFAPDELETPGDWNAGHAHLYLNDTKVARLYGSWFHLTGVEPGDHTLRVTLNTNDHRDLKVDGEIVEAIVKFTVPGS